MKYRIEEARRQATYCMPDLLPEKSTKGPCRAWASHKPAFRTDAEIRGLSAESVLTLVLQFQSSLVDKPIVTRVLYRVTRQKAGSMYDQTSVVRDIKISFSPAPCLSIIFLDENAARSYPTMTAGWTQHHASACYINAEAFTLRLPSREHAQGWLKNSACWQQCNTNPHHVIFYLFWARSNFEKALTGFQPPPPTPAAVLPPQTDIANSARSRVSIFENPSFNIGTNIGNNNSVQPTFGDQRETSRCKRRQ